MEAAKRDGVKEAPATSVETAENNGLKIIVVSPLSCRDSMCRITGCHRLTRDHSAAGRAAPDGHGEHESGA